VFPSPVSRRRDCAVARPALSPRPNLGPDLFELFEDWLQLAVREFAVIEVERGEVAAVHEAAQSAIGQSVGVPRIGHEFHRQLDVLPHYCQIGLEPFSDLLCSDPFPPKLALLLVKEVRGDAVGVESVEQLFLPLLESGERLVGLGEVLRAAPGQMIEATV
jgi:hypothetical protein